MGQVRFQTPDASTASDQLEQTAEALNDEQVLALADRLHDLLRRRRGRLKAKRRYAVMRCGTEWRVISGRGQIGHFRIWNEAFALSSQLAREAAEAGEDVELLIQSDWGELLPI